MEVVDPMPHPAPAPTKRLVFVVGLQKSGTTLMGRLLDATGLFERIDRGEGDAFWGNTPQFSPTAFPAGHIYQRSRGENGHVIDASDATSEIRSLLEGGLAASKDKVSFNKNPYNTVRLPWIRALFPHACIVAMVRRPVPNVYSLTKKFNPRLGHGLAPEEGWWGTKPANWQAMRSDNKIKQCAAQWAAVNAILWRDRDLVDFLIPYHTLCADPQGVLGQILGHTLGATPAVPDTIPDLKPYDDEYKTGGKIQSRNKAFRKTGNLAHANLKGGVEMAPFTEPEISSIRKNCGSLAAKMGVPEP